MQTQNRLLDDLARVAGGALDVAAGMRAEVETRLREQFEAMLARMDLVAREEFDAVQAMAAKAREQQEQLAERVAVLEAALGAAPGTAPKPAKKTTRKRAPKKGGEIIYCIPSTLLARYIL
jgi:BMFP domain-containing protein YqiC